MDVVYLLMHKVDGEASPYGCYESKQEALALMAHLKEFSSGTYWILHVLFWPKD